MMSQNIQSLNEQNVENIQYKKAETVLQMKLKGISRGKQQEGQGGLSGLSPFRSDGSHDSQAGRPEN
jgi:hypothetical protein